MKSKHISPEMTVLLLFVFAKFFVHLYTNLFAGYGIFRDELYYLACSNHLAAGYVDQPPLSIYILWLYKSVFGDSVFAIRLLPALAGALTVFFTGLVTRRLGGGVFAIIMSSIAVCITPIYLGMNSFYSMNSFDILLWAVAFYVLLRIIQNDSLEDWILFGIIVGLGMLNKISMAWLAIGFVVGLLLTPQRKKLLTVRPYLAGGIALLIFAPYIIWNITNDFPMLEFIHNATQYKYNGISRLNFISGLVLNMHPLLLPLWIAGLIYLLLPKSGRKYQMLGWIFITTFAILVINGHSKPEYLSPAFIPLFAGGSILTEKLFKLRYMKWGMFAVPVILLAGGIAIAPLAIPILPVEKFIQYSFNLGIQAESNEGKELSQLPQFYADMHGWEEMAKSVADIYHSLPEPDKQNTVIYAHNYGEAGAMDYYRDKYDLPPVICMHNNYWFWGKKHFNKYYSTIIIIGGKIEDHLNALEFVEQVAIHRAKYSIPYENNIGLFIGRNLIVSIKELWQRDKHFI